MSDLIQRLERIGRGSYDPDSRDHLDSIELAAKDAAELLGSMVAVVRDWRECRDEFSSVSMNGDDFMGDIEELLAADSAAGGNNE